LLVSPEWRRKGATKRMMAKLEEVARSEGRTLLVSLVLRR
jgi:GNAT superfamily N-acetyltransferase